MTSIDFNFAEPIASFADDSNDMATLDTHPADIGSLHVSNYVVLSKRPVKIVEVDHAKPGKHGHAKVSLVGIDIFTGRRYETFGPVGHMVQVPRVVKKDYIIIGIASDGFTSLLDNDTCKVRYDLKLNTKSDEVHQRLAEQYKDWDGEIKVTVLKALGEEKIVDFKRID